MRPTKNKVFCKDCERVKMLFETEKKADNFIKFNKREIEEESGYSPQRSYYCLFCDGWHLTSISEHIGASKKEQMFEQYTQAKEKKVDVVGDMQVKRGKANYKQERRTQLTKTMESEIKDMDIHQKELFFSEQISRLKNEIELLSCASSNSDREKLRDFRQELDVLYIVRKQNKSEVDNYNLEVLKSKELAELREKELEAWRLWAENKGY